VSADGEAELRPGGDRDPDRLASMRLRAERPRVTRLSRKVLAGAAAVGSAAIFGATFWALQNNRSHTSAPPELYTTDHHNVADGLTGLPRDYAGVPRQAPPLGPALPGDLGRPILNAQNAPSAGVPAIDSDQQRLDQEVEAARLSRLFASTGIREVASSIAQAASVGAATIVPNPCNQERSIASRRTGRIASSPSSMRQSIPAPQARIESRHLRRLMSCRQAVSSRRHLSPVSDRICPARSRPRSPKTFSIARPAVSFLCPRGPD
jgi:type IV secretion system protein TrbI